MNVKIRALIISGAAAVAALVYVLSVFFLPTKIGSKDTVRVYIEYGSGFNNAAVQLRDAGLLRDMFVFKVYAVVTGSRARIKAGEYEFSRSENMAAILNRLVKGDVIKYKCVFPEGSDLRDIAAIVEREGLGSAEEFLRLSSDSEFLKSIGIEYKTAEGLLFPDTYFFIRGEGERKIMSVMHARFREKVKIDLKARYNIQGLSLSGYGVIKLASLVEKESKLDTERPKVASVFVNRLKSAEPYQRRLESCATVRYALNKRTGVITYRDLRADSPYNTYIYIGLPPTPICSPGLKSIEAALNPSVTEYRYFVVREAGEHTFSETLEEHNAAKIQNRKSRGRK